MQIVPLVAEPNQSFSVNVSNMRFDIRLKEAAGVMVADVSINDVVVLLAGRVLAGEPLIPYRYLEAGNFLMLTDNGELPAWSLFGVTQTLVYLTAAETGG